MWSGNTQDVDTLEEAINTLEQKHGKARRIGVFDRGIVSAPNLEKLRNCQAQYVVGTPRHHQFKAYEQLLLNGSWQKISKEVHVHLLPQDSEAYVLARSTQRAKKEEAMRLASGPGIDEGPNPAAQLDSLGITQE